VDLVTIPSAVRLTGMSEDDFLSANCEIQFREAIASEIEECEPENIHNVVAVEVVAESENQGRRHRRISLSSWRTFRLMTPATVLDVSFDIILDTGTTGDTDASALFRAVVDELSASVHDGHLGSTLASTFEATLGIVVEVDADAFVEPLSYSVITIQSGLVPTPAPTPVYISPSPLPTLETTDQNLAIGLLAAAGVYGLVGLALGGACLIAASTCLWHRYCRPSDKNHVKRTRAYYLEENMATADVVVNGLGSELSDSDEEEVTSPLHGQPLGGGFGGDVELTIMNKHSHGRHPLETMWHQVINIFGADHPTDSNPNLQHSELQRRHPRLRSHLHATAQNNPTGGGDPLGFMSRRIELKAEPQEEEEEDTDIEDVTSPLTPGASDLYDTRVESSFFGR